MRKRNGLYSTWITLCLRRALEPHFDKETMEIHHSKHHQAYVNNANAALEGLAEFQDKCPGELISNLDKIPADKRTVLRNNAGGHAILCSGKD